MTMKDRVEKAVELFKSGYNCSQSVVAAFADMYGFTQEQALRMSASFGGGIGRMRQTCGAACGMAAAAAVDLLKGSTRQIGNAFALALKNILGLVCDPVGGLVEVPCVKRNAFHAVHALLAVEMAMNGIESVIPPDEVIEAMGDVGRRLPVELKETSRAGLAVTKTGRRINEEILKKSAMVK